MKCLVVDDSAITRRILVNSLRASGYDPILEATDGKQALQLCDATVDIVLTDWNMPGMGGIEMVRNLRANPAFAKLPILLVTARSVRDDVVEAAKAGVDGYVVKPFTPETLRNKIEDVLRHKSGPDGDDAAAHAAPPAGPAAAKDAPAQVEAPAPASSPAAAGGTAATVEPPAETPEAEPKATGTDG